MQAIICGDITGDKGKAKFETLNNKIWNWLVLHTGAQGKTWADPIIHPTDGRYACPVDLSRMVQAITAAEYASVITLTNDWFSKIEE